MAHGTAPVRPGLPPGCVGGLRAAGTGGWGRLRIGAACTSLALHAGLVTFALTRTPTVTRDGSGGSVPALTFDILSPGRDGAADPPESAGAEPSGIVAEAPSDDAQMAPDEEAEPAPIPRTPDAAMADQEVEVHEAVAPAPEAMAPRMSPEAPHPPVPAAEADRTSRAWEKRLRLHLNRFKRYPGGTSRIAGAVTLTFTLDDSGRLVSATIARSSGDPAFDQAALGMMARADPLPPPPERRSRGGLTFTLPVTFRAKRPGR